MISAHADLIHRLLDATNDSDPISRRSTLHDICTADFVYVDPEREVTGPSALDALFARVQSEIPTGCGFILTEPVNAHHQLARFKWKLGPDDGPGILSGSDVAVFCDGRIQQVFAFFDLESD